jgi:hypothetical protein
MKKNLVEELSIEMLEQRIEFSCCGGGGGGGGDDGGGGFDPCSIDPGSCPVNPEN